MAFDVSDVSGVHACMRRGTPSRPPLAIACVCIGIVIAMTREKLILLLGTLESVICSVCVYARSGPWRRRRPPRPRRSRSRHRHRDRDPRWLYQQMRPNVPSA
jgi:hypothetical protein